MELADETITHEATPIGYKTDASHPKGGRDEGNFVANAASQEIGSSTQALINGRHCSHGIEGTQASRVGRTRAGASRQSQVHDNSCASRYTAAKPPKASLHAVHGESTYEEGSQRTTERNNDQYSFHLQPNSVK